MSKKLLVTAAAVCMFAVGSQAFADGWAAPNAFGGYNYFSSGRMLGYTVPNPSGGVNIFGSGRMLGHTTPNAFGGQNLFGSGRMLGHTTPNAFGGTNFFGSGRLHSYSTPNAFGGVNVFGSGRSLGYTTPNAFGAGTGLAGDRGRRRRSKPGRLPLSPSERRMASPVCKDVLSGRETGTVPARLRFGVRPSRRWSPWSPPVCSGTAQGGYVRERENHRPAASRSAASYTSASCRKIRSSASR